MTLAGQALFAQDDLPPSEPLTTRHRRQTAEGEWERQCRLCGEYLPEDIIFFKVYKGLFRWECKDCANVHSRASAEVMDANNHKRRARKKKAAGHFTKADINALWVSQGGKCYWCGRRLVRKSQRREEIVGVSERYQIDHFIPLAKGGSNGADNLVLSCPTCNHSKGAKLPSEFHP